MEFRKQKRNAKILLLDEWRFWRLASVDEVKRNMEKIKQEQLLESYDIVRLLDGWVCGPGHRYELRIGYKDMGDMLLVKTPISRSSNGKFNEKMYSGVELNSDELKYALLFSCQDKITEVMCFVLKSIIDRFQDHGDRQAELDRLTESLKETFNHSRTVLHYATDQPHNGEHAEYVAELVLQNFEYGKELIKASDNYGRTALHFAALHGHINLCTFLMAECGLKADEKDRNGENMLHFVLNGNKVEILHRFIQIDEVRILIPSQDAKVKTLLRTLIASQDAKGKTPLHKAAASGSIDSRKSLIAEVEGSPVEYIRRADLFGQTALHEAASGGHHKAVEYLLEKGLNPLAERNSEGKTALHYSVQLEDKQAAIEMASTLLKHCSSEEEKSLLLWASATGIGTAVQCAESSPEVQTFLKRQRGSQSRAGCSSDLLFSSVKLGYDALAWELINRGANTSQLDNFAKSDLSHAHQRRIQKCMHSSQPSLQDPRDSSFLIFGRFPVSGSLCVSNLWTKI